MMAENIQKAEKIFDTILSAFGIKGNCELKYEEEHPIHANYSGRVTCTANLNGTEFSWRMTFLPASMTEEDFVNGVTAKLLIMLAEIAERKAR